MYWRFNVDAVHWRGSEESQGVISIKLRAPELLAYCCRHVFGHPRTYDEVPDGQARETPVRSRGFPSPGDGNCCRPGATKRNAKALDTA